MTLPNALNLAVTYFVPTVVWALLTVGVYRLVGEGRWIQTPQEPMPMPDLTSGTIDIPPLVRSPRPPRHEAILQVLDRAATDDAFIAQLTQHGAGALEDYDLTSAEQAALLSGDIRWIEEHVGELTPQQKTWLHCRLEQENW